MHPITLVTVALTLSLTLLPAAHAQSSSEWTVLLFGRDRAFPTRSRGADLVETLIAEVGGDFSAPTLWLETRALPGEPKLLDQLARVSSYRSVGQAELEGVAIHQFSDLGRGADDRVVALAFQGRNQAWFEFLVWGHSLALAAGLPPEARGVVAALAARVGPEESLATTEGAIRGLIAKLRAQGRDLLASEAQAYRQRIASMNTDTLLVWMDDREAVVLIDRASGQTSDRILGALGWAGEADLFGQ